MIGECGTTGADAKPVTATGIILLTSVLCMELCMNTAERHGPTGRRSYYHKVPTDGYLSACELSEEQATYSVA